MGADKLKKKSPKKGQVKPPKDPKSKPKLSMGGHVIKPPNAKKNEKKVKKVQKKTSATPVNQPKKEEKCVIPKERTKKLTIEEPNPRLPYLMYGHSIYELERDLAEVVDANTGRSFKIGDVAKAKGGDYVVTKILGTRTYVVRSKKNGRKLVMRTESSALPPEGPIFRREYIFLHYAYKETTRPNWARFLICHDRTDGIRDPTYSATFMDRCYFGLDVARQKIFDGGDFSKKTAIRLCLRTLEAISAVHMVNYIHRDIQPKNFLVGECDDDGVSTIKITGLAYSYDLKGRDAKCGIPNYVEVAKLPILNRVFQSRAWHLHEPLAGTNMDFESWIYMCYDFFSMKALPWAQDTYNEREMLSMKEAFFAGVYDDRFDALGIPRALHSLRNYFWYPSRQIDVHMCAHILMEISREFNVDWKEPYEWDNIKKVTEPVNQPEQDIYIPSTQDSTLKTKVRAALRAARNPSDIPVQNKVEKTSSLDGNVLANNARSTEQTGTTQLGKSNEAFGKPGTEPNKEVKKKAKKTLSMEQKTSTAEQDDSDEESSESEKKPKRKKHKKKKKASVSAVSATSDQPEK